MKRLDGKIALITGGTSGIGAATAQLFAQEGARVVISGRRAEQGAAVIQHIREAGGDAQFIRCDVRSADECQALVETTLRMHGRIDILFNNAGIVVYSTALETTPEAFRDVMDTNVNGTFYMCRAVLPSMIAQGSGVIVNNASDWGIVGGQNAAAYCASKGAVVLLTKALALDYGRQGIRVNAVAPGDTYVERWHTNWHAGAQTGDWDAYVRELGEQFPLGRVGNVDEIARAVLFLASDESSYMTGQVLVVDGGNTAGGTSARYE